MDKNEAKTLLEYILLWRKPDAAHIRELGNGEHIVILKKRTWHCWTPADWTRFQELESKR